MSLPPTDPRTAAGAAARQSAVRPAADPPNTILVVDDEPLARQMFTDLLEAQGFRVISVARGEEAFSFLGEVELVLLDAMLPGRDGWEICREIKEKHDALLPVIMVTARTAPEVIPRLSAALNDTLRDPRVQAALARVGADPASPHTPEEFGAVIRAAHAQWAPLIRRLNLVAE